MKIVTYDLVDKELKAILKAGGYSSKKAVVGHALEVLLAANPSLRLAMAVELYRSGEITLSRVSEIGGLDIEKGVSPCEEPPVSQASPGERWPNMLRLRAYNPLMVKK